MSTTPALLVAAGGVGVGHAVLPDHWVPLAVIGRTRGLAPLRVARLSALAGTAHVLVSVILGGVVIAVGLPLRSVVEHAQALIIGSLLILTGTGFALVSALGRGHAHAHPHDHLHPPLPRHDPSHTVRGGGTGGPGAPHPGRRALRARLSAASAIMVPFGAAASPDLTILPVFLAASALGAAAAFGSLLTFAASTIVTMVGLTVSATVAGYRLPEAWLARWGNALTALTLLIIGVLVMTGIL